MHLHHVVRDRLSQLKGSAVCEWTYVAERELRCSPLTVVIHQRSALWLPEMVVLLFALALTLLASCTCLHDPFDTFGILLRSFLHLMTICTIWRLVRPPSEFVACHCIQPLDYHGAVEELRVCVLPEPTRVCVVCAIFRRLPLALPYLQCTSHCHFRLPRRREAGLARQTSPTFLISLALNLYIGRLVHLS